MCVLDLQILSGVAVWNIQVVTRGQFCVVVQKWFPAGINPVSEAHPFYVISLLIIYGYN